MLWSASQRRVASEGRERMSEFFVAGRDAYVAGNVATGKATIRGGQPVPSYAQPDAATRRATGPGLKDLIRDFPGLVGGEPEFRN